MAVPGYLGCVLDRTGTPAGTCFQVADGVLVTAAHVLADVGADTSGSVVGVRALHPAGPIRSAVLHGLDAGSDLAVLTCPDRLPASVSRLCATDDQRLNQPVHLTGTVEVPQVDQPHEYLDAAGVWAGGTVLRDSGTALGRLSCRDVLLGMSGAPVRRAGDDAVIGVVSGRYNSVDGWLRDTVWVARIEDLEPLLAGLTTVTVDRAAAALGGAELARLTIDLLAAIDGTLTGAVPDTAGIGRVVDGLVAEVGADAPDGGAAFRDRLRRNGLEPSVLLAWLPQHARAIAQWSRHDDGSDAVLLTRLRSRLAAAVEDGRLPATGATAGYITGALRAVPDHGDYADRLVELVPVARSTSREFALANTAGAARPASAGPRSTPDVRARRLSHVAHRMCTLRRADRYFTGREPMVAALCTAIADTPDQPVAWISGRPGVGTSEFAVQVAHRISANYRTVLYVDMCGRHTGSYREPRTVARMLLEALGEPLTAKLSEDEVIYERLGQVLAAAGSLLVLDNAKDAGHVAPLVRCGGADAVIVTSRLRVQPFAGPGLAVHLPVLDRTDSVSLLARFLVRPDQDDHRHLARIAGLCDDLPLALRLIGARLAGRPDVPVAELARLLTYEHTRLNYLSDDERAVRSAVLLGYHDLDDAAQRTTRFLSAAPGAVSTEPELAHGLSMDEAVASLTLHRIVDASLGECEGGGRLYGNQLAFRLPELIRLVAHERLTAEEPADAVREFRRRSTRYLADRLAEIVDVAPESDLELEVDPTRAHAALDIAVAESWWEIATDLGQNLRAVYSANWDLPAMAKTVDLLVTAYLADALPHKAILAIHELVDVLDPMDSHRREALSWVRRAERIAGQHGLVADHIDSCLLAGRIAVRLQEYRTAFEAMTTARDLLERHGRADESLTVLINLTRLVHRSPELADGERDASWWGDRAVELGDRVGEPGSRAFAHFEKALAVGRAGQRHEAMRHYRIAQACFLSAGQPGNAAISAENTGYLMDDDPHGACTAWAEAVRLWRAGDEPGRLSAALVTLAAWQFRLQLPGEAESSLADALDVCPSADFPELADEITIRLAALHRLSGQPYDRPKPSTPPDDETIAAALRELTLPARTKKGHPRLTDLLRRESVHDASTYQIWLYGRLNEPAKPVPRLDSGTGP
jgi:hypothetical protein